MEKAFKMFFALREKNSYFRNGSLKGSLRNQKFGEPKGIKLLKPLFLRVWKLSIPKGSL